MRGSLIFAAICLIMIITAGLHRPPLPIYEYSNVSVLRQIAPNKWLMSKDDGEFLYTGCPDFPNDRVIWAGYVARKIRYEEQGNCKSILRSDLGVWWQRDANGNVIKIKEN